MFFLDINTQYLKQHVGCVAVCDTIIIIIIHEECSIQFPNSEYKLKSEAIAEFFKPISQTH